MNNSKTIPDILTERQTFYISEFDVEAAWLSFMHRELPRPNPHGRWQDRGVKGAETRDSLRH